MSRDPLAKPEDLIRRVYSYVAYRIGAGADAEDVTSETMLRAVRYRSTYDPARGKPITWLIGIARGCIADHFGASPDSPMDITDRPSGLDLEGQVLNRLSIGAAVAQLEQRDRELVALRYGADLSTREIARLLALRPNAVDVALHRCRERLRTELSDESTRSPKSLLRVARPSARPSI